MLYASQEVEGTPEPALHIPRWPLIRANIHDQCVHRKVVCLFKQETSEGRDSHCGNEVETLTTRHGNAAR